MGKRLSRSAQNGIVAGVCSGIAEYLEIDTTIVRLIWVLSIFTGIGVIAYIICWLIMPENNYDSSLSTPPYPSDSEAEISSSEKSERTKKTIAITLIIFGIILFLNNFQWFDLHLLFPIGCIVFGFYILIKTGRETK